LQMRCFYTTLLFLFFPFQVPQGKKKATQSVVQYVLMNSLKRSNEVMKFVLDTCQNADKCGILIDQIAKGQTILKSEADRIEMGLYLKETGGARWVPVCLLTAIHSAEDESKLNQIEALLTALNSMIAEAQLTDIH